MRELFDYPVFVAAPRTVGITSTGETGEGVASELPDLLEAYREFEDWLEQDAAPEQTQNFLVPPLRDPVVEEIERWIEMARLASKAVL